MTIHPDSNRLQRLRTALQEGRPVVVAGKLTLNQLCTHLAFLHGLGGAKSPYDTLKDCEWLHDLAHEKGWFAFNHVHEPAVTEQEIGDDWQW